MGKGIFGIVCLILAVLFSIAAINGMINSNFGVVLILPALAAVALILVGVKNYKGST